MLKKKTKKAQKKNIKLPLILITILLLIASVLIYSQKYLTNNDNETAIGDANTYINKEYSFKVTYPKTTGVFLSCKQNDHSLKQNPLKVIEDKKNNTFYISEANTREMTYILQSNGKYIPDYKNCQIVKNNLNLIKNGYINGRSDLEEYPSNISKPFAMRFTYSKIENENDLNNLAHKIYPNCYVKETELNKNMAGVYNVYLADKNGLNDDPDGKCWTNFVYFFYYSPANKSAVITSGFQNGPFFPEKGNGVPVIEFFK